MKRTVVRKNVGFGAALLMAGALFFSCSHEIGAREGTDDDSSGLSPVSSKVKFDFSGAKAIAQLEDSTGSARAAAADVQENFVKILADGSMESFMSVDGSVGSLADIEAVYKTPSDDVFVVFGGISIFEETWDESGNYKITGMGRLVCVHPDGEIIDILKVGNTDTYDIRRSYMEASFFNMDVSGNLYFVGRYDYDDDGKWANNGSVIYKFDPSSDSLTQIVAAVEGTDYSNFQITSDGSYIFAQGQRWGSASSSSFLRAIPVSNPNRFVNIYYSSDGWIMDGRWRYDDNSGIMYYILESGLYTVSKAGGFADKAFIGKYVGGNPIDWFKDFFDDKITADDLLSKIINACYYGNNIEFRYEPTDYTDVEALEYIKDDEDGLGKWFRDQLDYYESRSYTIADFIGRYCYSEGDSLNINERTNYNPFIYYTGLSDFSVTNTGVHGRFWSYYANNLCIIQMADSDGKIVEKTTKIDFPAGKRLDSQEYEEQLILRYALTDSFGNETGYHKLYSVYLDTGEIVDRFYNVANRDSLEVISYSAGADNLYFSAVRGTTVENKVVSLTTNEAEPLGVNRKILSVCAF